MSEPLYLDTPQTYEYSYITQVSDCILLTVPRVIGTVAVLCERKKDSRSWTTTEGLERRLTMKEAERLRIENEELATMAGLDEDGEALALNAGLRLFIGLEPYEPVWVTLRLPNYD